MIWFVFLNISPSGLQETERQAREEAMASVQVQDNDGGSGSDEK